MATDREVPSNIGLSMNNNYLWRYFILPHGYLWQPHTGLCIFYKVCQPGQLCSVISGHTQQGVSFTTVSNPPVESGEKLRLNYVLNQSNCSLFNLFVTLFSQCLSDKSAVEIAIMTEQ